MSRPHLPPELLDHVVDFLHDSRDALKNCCLVSKSWIPRTRKSLFADIQFHFIDDLKSWKATFPDPSTSPAYYAKTLFIGGPRVITAAGEGEGCWLSAFSRVVHFELGMASDRRSAEWMKVTLVPFHGFSPMLRSIRVASYAFPLPQIFNLICSFPLLKDVSLSTADRRSTQVADHGFNNQPTVTQPSSSNMFTGSLELYPDVEMEPIASILLSLPGGLRFRQLSLLLRCEADVSFATALVEECCSTLESLMVYDGTGSLPQPAHVNLSKATKLKDVEFAFWLHPRLLLTTLRTVTCDHRELEQITLTMLSLRGLNDPEDITHEVADTTYQEWLELDYILAQLNESHSIRLKVVRYNFRIDPDGSRERSRMKVLLPEAMTRGMVDLVGRHTVMNSKAGG